MSDTISILHLTDTHIKSDNCDDVKKRIDALTSYLQNESIGVDLVCFTGDLTYNGSDSEFLLFEKYVADPIKRRLNINDYRFLFIAGNHDIDRGVISLPEFKKLRKLSVSREAENVLKDITSPWPRLQNFLKYQSNHLPTQSDEYSFKQFKDGLFNTRVVKVKGIRIGIACLNSAWLCADDEDAKNLFLTEYQVAQAVNGLANCDFRIALCHHPEDWFNDDDRVLSCVDLHREFPLILTGHLHRPVSVGQMDTTGYSICITARALFEGKTSAKVEDGFHLYQLSIKEDKLDSLFRKYIRGRNTFDKDTDHAQNGSHSFSLVNSTIRRPSSLLVVQKLSVQNSVISNEIHKTLSTLQDTPNPVFVTPKLKSLEYKDGVRKKRGANLNLSDLLRKKVVICGAQDSGKTILLKSVAAEEEALAAASFEENSITLYMGGRELGEEPTYENIVNILEQKLSSNLADLKGVTVTIIIDGLSDRESEYLAVINKICDDYKWHFIVGLGELLVSVIAQQQEYKDILFVEIQPWGPSRIHQFALKLFENTTVNANLAYKFVSDCLRTVDLPATPTIISLYMSVFPKVGESVSSLSFLRLLEKIEQLRLGVEEFGTVESLYNRRVILKHLAAACLEQHDIELPFNEAENIVKNYFDRKKLDANPQQFLLNIVKYGFLRQNGENIGFSHYVFFDYYIALAFRDKLINDSDYTGDIDKCTRVAYALSLFAGLDRENITLAEKILGTIEATRTPSSELMLSDLDAHISHLLMPESRPAEEANDVAEENLASKTDYDSLDDEYERQKRAVADTRNKLLKQGIDTSVSDLELQVNGLHAFYSIFRNLENIDGEWKVLFLDRILDYHITTNFFFLDVFFSVSENKSFRTVAAYMLTLAGHGFMTSALGNPTLCTSICEVIDTTKNDFKKLLLLLLLSELEDSRSIVKIQEFIETTHSRAATEMLFIHMRQKLIDFEGKKLPEKMIEVFKAIFVKRQTEFAGAKNQGEAKNAFNTVIRTVKLEHWSALREKSIIDEVVNSTVVTEE